MIANFKILHSNIQVCTVACMLSLDLNGTPTLGYVANVQYVLHNIILTFYVYFNEV